MGGCEFLVCVPPTVCQLCEEEGHVAKICPFLRVRCKEFGCYGLVDVVIGVNEDETIEEKLLKCEIDSCPGNEVIKVTQYLPRSESPKCNPQ